MKSYLCKLIQQNYFRLFFILIWAMLAPLSSLQSAQAEPDQQTILVLGDSISAGFGLKAQEGWVDLMQQDIQSAHPNWQIVNASVSGDTTAGGLSRLGRLLDTHQPEIVIIELGGNDGLRGMPLQQIRSNLSQMIQQSQQSSAKVMLMGMQLPPNYGKRYTQAFSQVFEQVGKSYSLTFVPKFLEEVGTTQGMMQSDGIHPNAKGQPVLWRTVKPYLMELLQ